MTDDILEELSVPAADGTLLHVEGTPGDCATLILHGLGYASWAAASIRRSLGTQHGVWSLDNRGTGRSAPGHKNISIELLAADAATVADALGGAVHVVGYSMGGYIAQLLAVRRPDLVASMVLMSTSAGGKYCTPVPERTKQVWLRASGMPPEEYARATMPLSFRDGWPSLHAADYEAVIESRLRFPTPPDVWRRQYEACEQFLASGYSPPWPTVDALVMHGGQDRVLPVANGRALAAALPAARYYEVPAAGHLLHLEEPERIAALLSGFLAEHHLPQKKGAHNAPHRS